MCPSSDMATSIGRIILNLLSLEITLRLFLDEAQQPSGPTQAMSLDLHNLAVGDWVPETPLTSYDTLGQLIKKANCELEKHGLPERVDDSVVALRDALAHGRVLGDRPEGPFRVFKFSKPCRGMVRVEVSVEITQDWLDQQKKSTAAEAMKVVEAGRKLGLSCFPY